MRGETELTRFGKVRVLRRFVPGNRERPGFLGRFGRAEKYLKSKYKAHFAEGYGRATTQDYLHFLRIARGSAYELETQLVLAEDLGLCTQAASPKVVVTLQEVIRVLEGLIAALERRVEK